MTIKTAPFRAEFLPDTVRNREGMATCWQRLADLGYEPLTADEYEPVASAACERTRCHTSGHVGYPGSEHRLAIRCLLCGWEGGVFPSHMRPRNGNPPARHKGCTYSGARKAQARAGRYAELSLVLPEWDTDAAAHVVPVTADEERQAAEVTRTQATQEAAESRPAPKPATQPPKTAEAPGYDELRALLTFD